MRYTYKTDWIYHHFFFVLDGQQCVFTITPMMMHPSQKEETINTIQTIMQKDKKEATKIFESIEPKVVKEPIDIWRAVVA